MKHISNAALILEHRMAKYFHKYTITLLGLYAGAESYLMVISPYNC